MSLIADFVRALAQFADPRFRRVLWRSVLMVLAAFAALATAALVILARVLPDTVALPVVGEVGFVGAVAVIAAGAALVALSALLMVPATAAAIGFFIDDVVDAVEARHYPNVPPPRRLGLGRQSWDALRFFGLVVVANLAALAVLILAPPLAPFAYLAINGLLLGREYFLLVALRRLDAAAAERLRRKHAGRIWLAGVAMAAPLGIPIVNLLVPILGAAVFTHQFHRLAPTAAR